MDKQRDLELILQSRMPIVVIETRDESRVLRLMKGITISRASDNYVPLFRWTITDGLQRLDIDLEPQLHNSDPDDVLKHIRAVTKAGVYVLLVRYQRIRVHCDLGVVVRTQQLCPLRADRPVAQRRTFGADRHDSNMLSDLHMPSLF